MHFERLRPGFLAVCVLVGLTGFGEVYGQEGHPLTGTWSGDWGEDLANREYLTLVLRWDGERLTGIINPGPNSTNLTSVGLDVTDWTVRLEASRTDQSGGSVQIRAEGQLENLESYHRTLRGVWREGTREGDFVLTRD